VNLESPGVLFALFGLIPLVFVFLYEYRHARTALRQLGRAADDETVRNLLFGRWLVGLVCFGGFYVASILALAGWEWGEQASQRDRSAMELVVVVDRSRSMRARDVQPDRLSRGLELARAVVDALPDSRVALVTFDSRVFKPVPMTEDRLSLDTALAALRAGSQAVELDAAPPAPGGAGGSHLAQALDLALASFQLRSQRNQAMILVSDGEFTGSSIQPMVNQARRRGIPLAVIGTGLAEPSRIPLADGGWLQDSGGRTVQTRLQEAALRDLAERTRGWYVNAADADPAGQLAERLGQFVERSAREGFILVPVNRDYLFVILALVFLAGYLGVRAIRWRSIW
jgi:Ca-activated chloride channel family protein